LSARVAYADPIDITASIPRGAAKKCPTGDINSTAPTSLAGMFGIK